jgi:ABC-2 type transport system ATP-binding protein
MSGPSVLSVEGLTKRYGRKEAVSNISFSAGQSELIGLLGPNGAGKSTTLRMIAGSLAPSSGSVSIAGHDIAEQPGPAKSRIGYLPEVPPLYPEMTVGEYLSFACALKNASSKKSGTQADAAQAASRPMEALWMESLVSDLRIESKMSVLIRNLSKGYKQRVGIAAAMAGRPALLLLDEPSSGLDPRQAAELRSLLKRVSPHMTIIISSHGLYEISSLCTRIIIMNNGRIAADGQPDELAGGGSLEDVFISLTGTEES